VVVDDECMRICHRRVAVTVRLGTLGTRMLGIVAGTVAVKVPVDKGFVRVLELARIIGHRAEHRGQHRKYDCPASQQQSALFDADRRAELPRQRVEDQPAQMRQCEIG
jgi:hypothetical protein